MYPYFAQRTQFSHGVVVSVDMTCVSGNHADCLGMIQAEMLDEENVAWDSPPSSRRYPRVLSILTTFLNPKATFVHMIS